MQLTYQCRARRGRQEGWGSVWTATPLGFTAYLLITKPGLGECLSPPLPPGKALVISKGQVWKIWDTNSLLPSPLLRRGPQQLGWPKVNPSAGKTIQVSHTVAGTQVLGPSPATSQDALAGSRIGNRGSEPPTDILIWDSVTSTQSVICCTVTPPHAKAFTRSCPNQFPYDEMPLSSNISFFFEVYFDISTATSAFFWLVWALCNFYY